MVRIVIAGLLGGAVLFIWGAVSWLWVPWHQMGKLPQESIVQRALQSTGADSGVYWFPMMDPDEINESMSDEAKGAVREAYAIRHKDGPVGMLVYNDEGSDPMPMMMHVKGFLLYFVTALAAATMMSMAASSLGGYFGRVLFVLLLGVYVAVGTIMISWNYMLYPLRFSLEMAGDSVAGALLLGLVISGLIKPRIGGGGF